MIVLVSVVLNRTVVNSGRGSIQVFATRMIMLHLLIK